MVNVAIATLLFMLLGSMAPISSLSNLATPGGSLLARLAWVNVALVVFNLIPAFPMDGGRVLRTLLAARMNYARATQIAAAVGQGIAFVFGFVGLLFHPLLLFIALFVYLGASQEAAIAQVRDLSQGLPVSEAMITQFRTLPLDASVAEAADAVVRTQQHEFPIVRDDGRIAGMLTRDHPIRALNRLRSSEAVKTITYADAPTVGPSDGPDRAFRLMQESEIPALPVVDPKERPIGLITPEAVGEMMILRTFRSGERPASWRERHRGPARVTDPTGVAPRPGLVGSFSFAPSFHVGF